MCAVDIENVTPTVVVGSGGAGCSMVSTLHDLVREEGISDKFRFVGIDTNPDQLRRTIENEATGVTTVTLDPPEQWNKNKHEYDFLKPDVIPGGESQLQRRGALRKRRVGRYYVDSHRNFDDIRTHLTTVIESFSNLHDDYIDKQGQTMNIWMMNSLGGGTGSGSFPIISAILKQITTNSDWSSGNFMICGLGGLPNTDNVSEDNITYHLNSYAALRDIRVLTGEDDAASREIRLGEERDGVENDDRYELPEFVFDRYFLQPFDQDKMSSEAYRHQLNKSSASVPLYFSLIPEQENWPENLNRFDDERLFTFDTYELSVPVEDIFRYFSLREQISTLESDLADLESRKNDVVSDLNYLEDIQRVNIDEYIDEYQKARENVDDPRLTEVVPEQIELPDRVSYDMVETTKSAVGGLTLTVSNVEDQIEDRYNPDWDDTETDDVNHRDAFEYIFYQMVIRKAAEEKRAHRLHELVESKWNEYSEVLMVDFGWLDAKDAPTKWQDGLSTFLEDKIEEREEALPTGALFGGGFFLLLAVLLLGALFLNISQIQTLAETSVPLAGVPLSLASALVGVLLLIATGLFVRYIVPYLRLSSLKETHQECEQAYREYLELDGVAKEMNGRLNRIDFGEEIKQKKNDLEGDIARTKNILENQRTVRENVIERLESFKFEFDRQVALPIRDADRLEELGIKNTIREYVHTHPSIDLDVVNREIFDEDVEIDIQEREETERTAEIDTPNSIRWFTERNQIEEADVSRALNEILGEEQRLARSPLRDYTNKDPEVVKILQNVWNPINEAIRDTEGGERTYQTLSDNYNTDQPPGEITDEFRVWLMGVYLNFHLENSAVYADIDNLYAGSEDGDRNILEEFGLSIEDDPNFVTQRIAYPEFYETHDHPISDNVEKYPK